MHLTRFLLEQSRQPMIRFLGKRVPPTSKCTLHSAPSARGPPRLPALPPPSLHMPRNMESKTDAKSEIDHTPRPHPAAPSSDLPSSFASYRQKAQQHGPLNPGLSPVSSSSRSTSTSSSGSRYGGHIGSSSGRQLGSIEAGKGEVFDVSELPARFRRRVMSVEEIEAVESGGGSLFA